MSYIGNTPDNDVVINKKEYTATAGQTVFGVVYDAYVEVYVNGVKLATSDYTAAGNMQVTLAVPCVAGDIVQCSGYQKISTVSADSVANVPAGGISATTVQGAVNELDTEKVSKTGNETIAGVKTFSSQIVGSTSTQVSKTGDETIAGVKTFTGTVVLPSTTSIGNVSSTELGYLDGVTSNIQTQLNTKPSSLKTINGVSIVGSGDIVVGGGDMYKSTYDTTNNGIVDRAETADKLATARTIGGVSFDGTANINLPGVNTTGNQNTTGNAATATTATNVNGGTVNATTGRFDNDIIASQSITIGTGGNFSAGSIYSDPNWGMIFRAKQLSPAAAQFMWANSEGAELFRFNGTALTTNITGNSGTSTALAGDETNWASYRSRSVANMLSWKNYSNGHCIFDASASTAPNGWAVNNTNANIPWSPTHPTLMGWNGGTTYGVRVDSARVADSTTYASAFTTAVGSAPSYACRAWVNFDGTGTVAIRASGNVSSITDNGTGDYTVNFTTAMVDANYSAEPNQDDGLGRIIAYTFNQSSVRLFLVGYNNTSRLDSPVVTLTIFR